MTSHRGFKVYVADTSYLVHDPGTFDHLGQNHIVVPLCVVEELDKLKARPGEVGVNARTVSRKIDELRQAAVGTHSNLRKGVETAKGGMLYVDPDGNWPSAMDGMARTNDNSILAIGLAWQEKERGPVIILSMDTNMRIKADTLGLMAETPRKDRELADQGRGYTGVTEYQLGESPEVKGLFNEFGRIQTLPVSRFPGLVNANLVMNQGLVLQSGRSEFVLAVNKGEALVWVKKYFNGQDKKGDELRPRNVEQALAYHLLTDPTVSIVSMNGRAGTGKTLLSLMGAFRQHEVGACSEIQIFRPNIEIGQEIGFLPGNVEEKFAPWKKAIYDNLLAYYRGDHDRADNIKEMITIEPVNFVRGRSLVGMFVIVDEAQNLTRHEIKTVITRAGEGTKVILIGDLSQIDNNNIDVHSSGLACVIAALKGQAVYGHITLIKGERSPLAELVAELL